MLCRVVRRTVKCSKWSVIRHAPPLYRVPVVVQQVSLVRWVKQLPRSRILLLYPTARLYLPKIVRYRLKQLILRNWKTQVLAILIKDRSTDNIGAGTAFQVLNHHDGVFNFAKDFVIISSTCLNVRVVSEVEGSFNLCEAGKLVVDFDSFPKSLENLFSCRCLLSFESMYYFLIICITTPFLVENIKYIHCLCYCYVYFLILYHRLKLV